MKERFIRLPEVISRTGMSKPRIYALQKEGSFPRNFKLGTHAAAWRESEIEAWMTERLAAAGK